MNVLEDYWLYIEYWCKSKYELWESDKLFYSVPIIFLFCVAFIVYAAITTLIDDRNWPPKKRALRKLSEIIRINGVPYRRLEFRYKSIPQAIKLSRDYFVSSSLRRSIRKFSKQEVPLELMENVIRCAYTAPSYLNLKPFYFVVINNRSQKMQKISELYDNDDEFVNENIQSDHSNYNVSINERLGILPSKQIIANSPYLVILLHSTNQYEHLNQDERKEMKKSTGIALGFLLSALHNVGLYDVVLSPPKSHNTLFEIIEKPHEQYQIYSMIAVGFPDLHYDVPVLRRFPITDFASFLN